MKYLLKLVVYFYRYLISPLLPNRCIYYPTCSTYALEALETHGALKGSLLAIKRIFRCNPLAKGGYDPVPEKGCWHNGVHQCESVETQAAGESDSIKKDQPEKNSQPREKNSSEASVIEKHL
jgi:putative membrane protein insertion efficiency factor